MSFSSFLSSLLTGQSIALLATTITAAVAGIGSAKAVGRVGALVSGILTEDPSKFGKLVILQALPGTQGIYGLMTWFLYLIFSGTLTGNPQNLTLAQGLMIAAACVPMTVVGYSSAIHQGNVAAAGCAMVSKQPAQQAKALILAAMVETYAIFALLIAIMTMLSVLVF